MSQTSHYRHQFTDLTHKTSPHRPHVTDITLPTSHITYVTSPTDLAPQSSCRSPHVTDITLWTSHKRPHVTDLPPPAECIVHVCCVSLGSTCESRSRCDVCTRRASEETSHDRQWRASGGQETSSQKEGQITQWLNRSVLPPTDHYSSLHQSEVSVSSQTDDRDAFFRLSQQVTSSRS